MSGFTPYGILAIFGPPYFLDVFTNNEFWPVLGPSSPLTFHNVKNHGGGAQKESQEELPGTKNKRKQRKQHIEENQNKQKNNKERHWGRDKQYSPCFL